MSEEPDEALAPATAEPDEAVAPATEEPEAEYRSSGRRRAASIYGTIVTAAVLTAGGGSLDTPQLAVTVLVTLVVYWLAEEYAELIGVHVHAGQLPSLRLVGGSLATTWAMVTASFLPLLVLLLSSTFSSTATAAEIALGFTVVLLTIHSLTAARAAGLRGFRLVAVTSLAAALGMGLVILKAFLHARH